MLRTVRRILLLASALVLSVGSVQAERNDPGSLLIFPEYDSRPGSYTFLTVTNLHSTESIRVHFNYVSGDTCMKSDALETMTPRDTVTFFSTTQSPTPGRGYCYAYARGMSTSTPIDFDYLIATQITLDGMTGSQYQINAMVFEGMTGEGNPTDLDFDGNRDLDGLEYAPAPDRIAIPRFFGQIPGNGQPRADLILIGLTGSQFETTASLLIYNDNEEVFSSQVSFDCWDRIPLTSISGAFLNSFLLGATNNDPGEILGFANFESGWFELNGLVASSTSTSISQPAMLATMIEVGRLSSASLPFTVGEQTNGQLLPLSVSGN